MSDVDVAVVGAGPAGIAAATAAAEAGRAALLLDAAPRPGGQIWRHHHRATLPRAARRALERLERSGARVLCGASVVDAEAEAGAACVRLRVETEAAGACFRLRVEADAAASPPDAAASPAGDGAVSLAAARVVLATGARERFLPFPGWTLPGVTGLGGAQALLKSGLDVAGWRVVVAGTGPLLLPVAAALARGGARVAFVAEQAPRGAVVRFAARLWRTPATLARAAALRAGFASARYRAGTWVSAARGEESVRWATLTDGRRSRDVPCDLLAVGYGLVGADELPRRLGCAVTADGRVAVDRLQRTSVDGVYCAGDASAVAGAEAALLEGRIAGLAAAGDDAAALALAPRHARFDRFAARLEAGFRLRPELRELGAADTVVCRCEDVPLGRIDAAWSMRQAKLYTRAGMGPCQGRVCGPALRFLFDAGPDSVRAPIFPARIASLITPPASAGDR